MHDDTVSARRGHAARTVASGRKSRGAAPGMLGVFDWLLQRHGIGSLQLTLPSGAAASIGNPDGSVEAQMALKSYGALWKLARRGALGFAESYMDGDIDTDDLQRHVRALPRQRAGDHTRLSEPERHAQP